MATLPPLGRFSYTPHAHECSHCRFRWAHDPDVIQTEQEFDRAHDCPRCGYHETAVYRGKRKPLVLHDGMGPDQSLQSVPVRYVEEEEDETRPRPPLTYEELIYRLFGRLL